MKKRKLVAPVIITVLFGLWALGWCAVLLFIPRLPLAVRVVGMVIALALLGAAVFMLFARIREIRSGEEDDLSQY